MSASSRQRRQKRPIEAFVPEIYTMLTTATVGETVDQRYLQALQQLIAAAYQNEQHSGSFSILPLLACQAAGGVARRALPVAAAWRSLHLAGKLLDSIAEDHGAPFVPDLEPANGANYAAGLLGAMSRTLDLLPAKLRRAQQQDFVAVLFKMSGGRHMAIRSQAVLDLEGYWHILDACDGACFALAMRAGAHCGSTDPIRILQYSQCGYNVGIMRRIAEDLADFHTPTGMGAWVKGRRTLPVLYALQVAPLAEQDQLAALLERTAIDHEAEAQARHLIVMSGAEVYVRSELTHYHSLALSTLAEPYAISEPDLLRLAHWIESQSFLAA